ncbi:RDD family protein [Radiobacillus kanasensis]|uniref:RDD family protein n=1 Tax=Radiobacillus kanasensis TaxID=2844358 RepID=UPI001E2A7E1A|nr:RDD family protein [Radiobacillus kanasensis]UFT99988.1 RDD family protein [Radiobacillus kanasensis]
MVDRPVGFGSRFLAGLMDGLLIGIPISLIGSLITGEQDNWITTILESIYYLLVPVLWVGYTVGKRIMGIRIVKLNEEKLGIGTMILRYFVSGIIYALTLGIALIVSAFMVGLRDDRRAIHDMIAGTYVTFAKPEA